MFTGMIQKEFEELIKEGTGGELVQATIKFKGVEITFEKDGRFVMFALGSKMITKLSKDIKSEDDLLKVIKEFI